MQSNSCIDTSRSFTKHMAYEQNVSTTFSENAIAGIGGTANPIAGTDSSFYHQYAGAGYLLQTT